MTFLTRKQTENLRIIHQRFARNFSTKLADYLCRLNDVSLRAIDDSAFSPFISSLPGEMYFRKIAVDSLGGNFFIAIEPRLLFYMIDEKLNLKDKTNKGKIRAVTGKESSVIDDILTLITSELQSKWWPIVDSTMLLRPLEAFTGKNNLIDTPGQLTVIGFEIEFSGEIKAPFYICYPQAILKPLEQMLDTNIDGFDYSKKVRKILVLFANPTGHRKQIDREIREIRECIERSKKRDFFYLKDIGAMRFRDFRRNMLDTGPNVIHIIAEGTKSGLIIEDSHGKAELLRSDTLYSFLDLFKGDIECVILSAGFTSNVSEALCSHIDFVIGMPGPIGDEEAIHFSIGFYDALCAGETVEKAYGFGVNDFRRIVGDGRKDLAPILKRKIDLRE